MFAKRNHITDPPILIKCPFCSKDLYPFKNIDRFELVLETIADLKRSFIKIKCLNCESIFRDRTSNHKVWLKYYRKEVIEQHEKQMSKLSQRLLNVIESGSEKK